MTADLRLAAEQLYYALHHITQVHELADCLHDCEDGCDPSEPDQCVNCRASLMLDRWEQYGAI